MLVKLTSDKNYQIGIINFQSVPEFITLISLLGFPLSRSTAHDSMTSRISKPEISSPNAT